MFKPYAPLSHVYTLFVGSLAAPRAAAKPDAAICRFGGAEVKRQAVSGSVTFLMCLVPRSDGTPLVSATEVAAQVVGLHLLFQYHLNPLYKARFCVGTDVGNVETRSGVESLKAFFVCRFPP